MTKPQLQRLLEVGRWLVTDLDLESVLNHVLVAARELTDARYAALGILDSSRETIERFLFLGLDEETRRRIGPTPKGRGVLGELIRDPKPLRLADVGAHPSSYGFPADHPPMSSFVGVPLMIRGEAFGNLFLTNKRDASEFDSRDEQLLTVLADWAAVAIENARLYEDAERRGAELERAVRGLEATVSLSRLGTPIASLDWLLETIAKRGRALIESTWFVLLRPGEANSLVASNVAGEAPAEAMGASLPNGTVALSGLLADDSVRRLAHGDRFLAPMGAGDQTSMVAVLDNRGRWEGFVVAVAPVGRREFSADDEVLLSSFATSAAGAIGTIGEAEKDRLRLSVQSSERERHRWARELHDETLQQLGAMKLMHESALKRDDPDIYRRTVARAASEFDESIESLERLITELRPVALDELGAEAAIEALADKVSTSSDLEVELEIELAREDRRNGTRYTSDLETTLYRIVQEGLHNVIKHAEANRVSISVIENGDHIELAMVDDGKGIVDAHRSHRFGLSGIRERVELVGGEMKVESAPQKGTTLRAILPLAHAEAGS